MLTAEIAQYIEDQTLGTFDATGITGNIFLETLPDAEKQGSAIYIALYSTGGYQSGGKLAYDDPTVQIIVRGGLNPLLAWSKAQSIYNLLHGFSQGQFMAGGQWIVNCQGMQSGPINLGPDENRQHRFSLNFHLHVQNLDSVERE